jgi:hypothetical protein
VSTPTTAPAPSGGTLARQFTEPLRELSVLALLGGNAVFLFLGFSDLFLVIDRWASDFGLRCAQVFPTFVGPISLGLPIAAMLLATHVAPMIRRARLVLIVVLAELGVSALFGAITFLGGFAHDLSSARATIENTLWRIVWLGFLVLACVLVARLWLGLYPTAKPGPAGYSGYGQPSYGRPYPGQPLYPQDVPTYSAGAAPVVPGQSGSPAAAMSAPTPVTGWPVVPPPPMPEPLVVPVGDLTQRLPRLPDVAPEAPASPAPASAAPASPAPTSPAAEPLELAEEPVGQPTGEQVTELVARPDATTTEPAEGGGEPPTRQMRR